MAERKTIEEREYLECTDCSATTARNYFYEGIPLYLPKDKLIPFLGWLSKNYIDIRHEATPHNGGYILTRDARKYKNPLKN
jgi:hypothetical protein